MNRGTLLVRFYNDLSNSISPCLLNLDTDVSTFISFLFGFKSTDICHCQLSPPVSALASWELETSAAEPWKRESQEEDQIPQRFWYHMGAQLQWQSLAWIVNDI